MGKGKIGKRQGFYSLAKNGGGQGRALCGWNREMDGQDIACRE